MANESKVKEPKELLGFWAIFLITVNSIIGTGIFFLPAIGVREAGLFSILSWLVMSLVAIYIGMIFAELIGIFPKEGGTYEYAKQAFGHFPSFILGWMTLIAANITIAMLIVGAIKYVGPFLSDFWLIVASIAFIVIFNYMAFKGLKTGATMLVAFAIITLTAVFGIIIPGLFSFNLANFTGWFSHSAFVGMSPSILGIIPIGSVVFVTIFFIAETFFGWETATFLAEKVDNPKKVMPKVMIGATVAIAIICMLFIIASLSLINWNIFGTSSTPLSDLAAVVYSAEIAKYYGILVYMAIIGSVAGWIVASPNLIVALAKDKLFIPQLSKINPKTNTASRAILFQTFFTSLLVIVGAGSYETLLHLLVPLLLILYGSVVLSLRVIRKKFSNVEKPYTAPFGNFGLISLMLFIVALITMWLFNYGSAIRTMSLLISFVIIGVPVFIMLFFYYEPDATLKFKNETASLSLYCERIFFPKWIHKKVLENSIIKDKVVLELGANTGLLSRDIAKRHPKEQIIIEQTPAMKRVLMKRTKGEHNVRFIVDEHLISRVHNDVSYADEIFSFGLLSDLQNEKAFFKQVADILPEHGRIHFFDYVDLYKFIPNKEILSDLKSLKKAFRDVGLAVNIRKVKGLFWNYLIIDGIKTKHADAVFI